MKQLPAFFYALPSGREPVREWLKDLPADDRRIVGEDIKDVDTGVYHERLLDIFDVDGDGDSEVFSYVMSFEGAGFNVYKRKGDVWVRHFEGSNYHCGY